ncbi:hypothetical protein ACQ4PT_027823 [Festuca glaucescens]
MELRSSQRLRRSSLLLGAADPLSTLPDDMLLQILVCLRYIRAAARTSLLSHRWLGLWARLPGLVFRYVPTSKIEAVLARAALPTSVSLIDIRLLEHTSSESCKLDDTHAKSLLRGTMRLSPEEHVLILPECPMIKPCRPVEIAMPLLRHATSILPGVYGLDDEDFLNTMNVSSHSYAASTPSQEYEQPECEYVLDNDDEGFVLRGRAANSLGTRVGLRGMQVLFVIVGKPSTPIALSGRHVWLE